MIINPPKLRQTQLSDKQQTMRENVVKFERFIRENDTKRQRAEQKAIMEAKILKTKESEERRLLDTFFRKILIMMMIRNMI